MLAVLCGNPLLTSHEREAFTQFKQKLLQLINQALFQLTFTSLKVIISCKF